jgi:hypothetical protein
MTSSRDHAVVSDTPAASPAGTRDHEDGPLNLAERMLARAGLLASLLAEHWTPPPGPFFASDGCLALHASALVACPELEPAQTAG